MTIKSSDMTMYIVTHKPFVVPDVANYLPLAVGQFAQDSCCPFITDSTGRNISSKNANYCELTALYWIVNNSPQEGIVGLSHYRRYFSNNSVIPSSKFLLNEHKAVSLLDSHDIILPEKWVWTDVTVSEQYCRAGIGHISDLNTTRAVIADLDSGYLDAFDNVLCGHAISCFNMFVAKRKLINEYASWLFPILFEVEKRIDISAYDVQEARVFGYLSERLLNVWVLKNKLDACYLPVINTGMNDFKNAKSVYRQRYKNFKVSHCRYRDLD